MKAVYKIIVGMKTPVKPFVVAAALVLASCGGKQFFYEGTAEELHAEVQKELSKTGRFFFGVTNYDKVFEILKEIQIRYTYTPYAALAQLRTGDVYFKRNEYRQAVAEYENFIANHPSHEDLDYATYRLGLSYYKIRSDKDRDYAKLEEAIHWFTELEEDYPDSLYLHDARRKVSECRKTLAEREIYIGNFYKKKRNYLAAAKRYENVLEKYSDTEHAETAARLLTEVRGKLAEQGEKPRG